MKAAFPAIVIAALLLVGCETKDTIGSIKDFGATASGAMQNAKDQVDGVIEQGKTAVEGVNDIIEDAKNRINQVQSGVDLLMDGKEMIEGGIKGE